MQSEYKSSLIIFKSCQDVSDRLSMNRLIVAHVEAINVWFTDFVCTCCAPIEWMNNNNKQNIQTFADMFPYKWRRQFKRKTRLRRYTSRCVAFAWQKMCHSSASLKRNQNFLHATHKVDCSKSFVSSHDDKRTQRMMTWSGIALQRWWNERSQSSDSQKLCVSGVFIILFLCESCSKCVVIRN